MITSSAAPHGAQVTGTLRQVEMMNNGQSMMSMVTSLTSTAKANGNEHFWDNFWKFKLKEEEEKNAPPKEKPMMKVVKRLTDRKTLI